MPSIGNYLLGLSCAALCACAALERPRCPAGQHAVVHDTLYFGASTTTGVIAEDQWSEFLKITVTPRFPMGLTLWPALGQWRSGDGRIVHESSHVLDLVHADDFADEASVLAIVDTYKVQFRQEAVLRVRSAACASP